MTTSDSAITVDFKPREQIERDAAEVLRKHGLYAVPVDPVVLANREGIRVHNARFSDSALSGMIAKRGDNVTLLVNQVDPPFRKRFTIAHELGHHFLHLLSDGDFVDSRTDLFRDTESEVDPEDIAKRRPEIQANQFAAALLMPEELVRDAYERTQNLSELSRLFNVSESAMGYRLTGLGLV